MSVLNEIITTVGDGVREISRGLNHSRGDHWLSLSGRVFDVRLDKAEYSQDPDDVDFDLARILSPHWVEVDGMMSWGIPGGDFSDYTQRLKGYSIRSDVWMPPETGQMDEQVARDLTMASVLFPMRVGRHKSDPCVEHGILRVLEATESFKHLQGSSATARLIKAVGDEDAIGKALSMLTPDDTSKAMEFAQYSTMMAIVCSTNSNDSIEAGKRVGATDMSVVGEGSKYMGMANLANFVERAMNASGAKGKHGRNMRRLSAKVEIARQTLAEVIERGSRNIKSAKEEYEYVLTTVSREALGSNLARRYCYAAKACPDVVVIPSSQVALVIFKSSRIILTLTRTDLLNIKFVSMSHSMWHYYRGTLAMEYVSTTVLRAGGVLPEELATAVGQLRSTMADLPYLPHNVATFTQAEVPYRLVKRALDQLWVMYCQLLDTVLRINKADYLGRYLHELFEAYTSTIGGELAEAGAKAQMEELIDSYEHLGFCPDLDMKELSSICDKLPMSAIQDFARLSKIVYAYDVNPAYSFIDRCNKMSQPNPLGKGVKVSDYKYDVEQFTEEEHVERENRFKSACRVMLAAGHVKTMLLTNLTPDEAENCRDLEWDQLLAKLRSNHATLASAVKLRTTADIPVPRHMRASAAQQAGEFVANFRLPENEYAGAFLNITNLMPYRERSDPDLALIKATSLASMDIYENFSDTSGEVRSVSARTNLGRRERPGGDMASEYLCGRFPSRPAALAHMRRGLCMAGTSSKVETNKCPTKTREITSFEAGCRRIQGEFEYNNGLNLSSVPGFTVGEDPNDLKKKIYAGLRMDLLPDETRLYISLDLSGWSPGMHWDVQQWTNEALSECYAGGDDMFQVLGKGTKGAVMFRSSGGLRLAFKNRLGANFEGIDGKRNTFMHCVMWYMARCDAARAGVTGSMRAFLFIDDGSAILRCKKAEIIDVASKLRDSMMRTYLAYGFKLSLLKTVISEHYMQFLNEIYLHGAHIGYGFRALCHTGAQSFPPMATVREELSVIYGGIRGATVSGGHPLRLLAGMGFILWNYVHGVIGLLGKALLVQHPLHLALALYVPSIAGGFGCPGATSLFSNLEGHPDIEKLATCRSISRACRKIDKRFGEDVGQYMKANLMRDKKFDPGINPDRLSLPHPGSVPVGDLGRDEKIARAALEICVDPLAKNLIREYLNTGGKPQSDSFVNYVLGPIREANIKMPTALAQKVFATDERAAMSVLVTKIASSRLVNKFLEAREVRFMRRRYFLAAQQRIRNLAACC